MIPDQQTNLLVTLALLLLSPLVLSLTSATTPSINSSSSSSGVDARTVLVTGASGRTGRLVLEQLQRDPRFIPKALVRSERSARTLRRAVPTTKLEQIVICDVVSDLVAPTTTMLTSKNLDPTNKMPIPIASLEACEAMVICTSAVPTISKVSLLKALMKAPFNLLRGKKAIDFRQLTFVWKNGGYPELVDYYGQVAQINLVQQLPNMKQIVVVGSMGGTDPNNFLNAVGKNSAGTGNGDILLWKRQAERYLVYNTTNLDYTIIHPGGLIDTPPGLEEYVLDVDDKLLANKKRSISRHDVARLCVAALVHGRGHQISFDCITVGVDGNDKVKPRSAEEVYKAFLKEHKSCNYQL